MFIKDSACSESGVYYTVNMTRLGIIIIPFVFLHCVPELCPGQHSFQSIGRPFNNSSDRNKKGKMEN